MDLETAEGPAAGHAQGRGVAARSRDDRAAIPLLQPAARLDADHCTPVDEQPAYDSVRRELHAVWPWLWPWLIAAIWLASGSGWSAPSAAVDGPDGSLARVHWSFYHPGGVDHASHCSPIHRHNPGVALEDPVPRNPTPALGASSSVTPNDVGHKQLALRYEQAPSDATDRLYLTTLRLRI